MKRNLTNTIAMGALIAAFAAATVQAQTGASTGSSAGSSSGMSSSGAATGNTGPGNNTSSNSGDGNRRGVGTGTQVDTNTRTPAVATPDSRNPNAPVAGRNSFTQSQVMTRLSRAGYTNISNLQRGSDGIWRATGVKNGQTHNLMFDYQGNITTGTR